jgi:SAM-dependent methyltransferase
MAINVSRRDAPADAWASGAAYEPFIGRWSRLVARTFVAWLGVPRDRTWIDVGSGTGALTSTVLTMASPSRVTAFDASAAFASYARTIGGDRRIAFAVADARAIPFKAASADVAVSGLMLNFVPQPEVAVAEMARVARPGGTVSAYVWDYSDGMQMLRHFWDAASAVDPGAADLDEGRRFPMCEPSALDTLWRGAGLRDVEVRGIDVPTRFESFDDLWTPFLGGQGPAPSYLASLDSITRERVREQLRVQLPDGGSFVLTARAWAVRGVRS